jgi:hypothetical protein
MSEHHHHHHHHRKDSATIFKEKSLRAIELRRLFEKWLKIAVIVLAIVMVILLILAYTIG